MSPSATASTQWKDRFDASQSTTVVCQVEKLKYDALALTNRIYTNCVASATWVKVSNASPIPGANRSSFYVCASPEKDDNKNAVACMGQTQRLMFGFTSLLGSTISIVIPTRRLSLSELPPLETLEIYLEPLSKMPGDSSLSQETLEIWRKEAVEYLTKRPLTTTQRFVLHIENRYIALIIGGSIQDAGIIQKDTLVDFHFNQKSLPRATTGEILGEDFFDVTKRTLTVCKSLNEVEAEMHPCVLNLGLGYSEYVSIKGPLGSLVFKTHQDLESEPSQIRLSGFTRSALGVSPEGSVEVMDISTEEIKKRQLTQIVVYIKPFGKGALALIEAPFLAEKFKEKLPKDICNKNQLFFFKVNDSSWIAEVRTCKSEGGTLDYGYIDPTTQITFAFDPNLEVNVRGLKEINSVALTPDFSPFTIPVETHPGKDFEFSKVQSADPSMGFSLVGFATNIKAANVKISSIVSTVASARYTPLTVSIKNEAPRDVVTLPYSMIDPMVEIVKILPQTTRDEGKPVYSVVNRSQIDPKSKLLLPNKYMLQLKCDALDQVTVTPLDITLANAPTIDDVEITVPDEFPLHDPHLKREIANSLLNQLIFDGFPLMVFHQGNDVTLYVKNLKTRGDFHPFGIVRDKSQVNVRTWNSKADQAIAVALANFGLTESRH